MQTLVSQGVVPAPQALQSVSTTAVALEQCYNILLKGYVLINPLLTATQKPGCDNKVFVTTSFWNPYIADFTREYCSDPPERSEGTGRDESTASERVRQCRSAKG